jgi:hypothetical protein
MALCGVSPACTRGPRADSSGACPCEPNVTELNRLLERVKAGENVCPELLSPRIEIAAGAVSLDGERLGGSLPTRADQRFEPLLAALSKKRNLWKSLHPEEPLHAVAALAVHPNVSVALVGAVARTAAEVGFAALDVQVGDTRQQILCALLPPLPSEEVLIVAAANDGAVRLRFEGRPTPRLGLSRTLPPAQIAELVTTECKVTPGRCVDRVTVRGDFQRFEALARAVREAVGHTPIPSRRVPVSFEAPPPVAPEPFTPAGLRGDVRVLNVTIDGPLQPNGVREVVVEHRARFGACYAKALEKNPTLEGRVSARFVVGRDGVASNVSNAGSDFPNRDALACVLGAWEGLQFAEPQGNVATVVVPIWFSPK